MTETKTRDLVFTRIFDAPLEHVWKAWTDPAHVMQWWGPNHFSCPSAVIDLREGGTSIVCMRAPKEFGGQDMYNSWGYTRIVPMQSIEFIQNLCGPDGNKLDPSTVGLPSDFPRDQRNLVTFRTTGANQTELVVTEFGWTEGQMMKLGEMGMNQCLDKMAASFHPEH